MIDLWSVVVTIIVLLQVKFYSYRYAAVPVSAAEALYGP